MSSQPTAGSLIAPPLTSSDRSHRSMHNKIREALQRTLGSSIAPAGYFVLPWSCPVPENAEISEGSAQASPASSRQCEWERSYGMLADSSLLWVSEGVRLPSLSSIYRQVRQYATKGFVPIMIAHVDYHVLPQDVQSKVESAVSSLQSMDLDQDVLLESPLPRRTFSSASAMLPLQFDEMLPAAQVHHGSSVTFVVAQETLLANGRRIENIVVDFGDGAPEQRIRLGVPVTVHYPYSACSTTRYVTVSYYVDGKKYKTVSEIAVCSVAATPVPNVIQPLVADIPYINGDSGNPSVYASGVAYVFYSSKNTTNKLQKPFVIADGFPTDVALTSPWGVVFSRMSYNGGSLTQELLDAGYDIVFLTYHDGTIDIRGNAYLLAKCIQWINGIIPSGGKSVVCGASMGGIVARYGLCYMEQQGIPHQVSTYLSFDSPHLGAHMPPSVSYILQYLNYEDYMDAPDSQARYSRLLSTAARQMLVYCLVASFDHYTQYWGAACDPLFTSLQNDLAQMGLPKQTANYAVSNGACDGKILTFDNTPTGQSLPINANVCSARKMLGGGGFLANLCSLPNASTSSSDSQVWTATGYTAKYAGSAYYLYSNAQYCYDGAPGGQFPAWGTLAELIFGTDTSLYVNNVYTGSNYCSTVNNVVTCSALFFPSCFVPTFSALCMSSCGPFDAISSSTSTPFTKVCWSTANGAHVSVNDQIAAFLRGIFISGSIS